MAVEIKLRRPWERTWRRAAESMDEPGSREYGQAGKQSRVWVPTLAWHSQELASSFAREYSRGVVMTGI